MEKQQMQKPFTATRHPTATDSLPKTDCRGFSVYPNPSSGSFNIDVDGAFEVSVTNIQGQLVYTGTVNGQTQIDLGAQPDGVYFIRLQNATHTLIERIVIR